MRRIAFFFTLLLLATPSFAVQPDEILPDVRLETRARELSAQLRCMVCQNQSIDDSDAPLARDLRVIVRQHLQQGESDAQIKDYLVARYGDFILLKPPVKTETLLLWASPFAVLILGALAVFFRSRDGAARKEAFGDALSAEERQKLDALLGDENGEPSGKSGAA